jgi:metal-responsive CopG/Arc/MetJ family transcriptional regulator
MPENRKMISIRLPPAVLEQLDAYRNEFEFPPQRTAIIVEAVKRYLAEQKSKTPAPKKK